MNNNNYQIFHQIGRGIHGTIFIGQYNNQQVAIKKQIKCLTKKQNDVYKLLSDNKFSNVISTLNIVKDDVIIMEYANGGNLYQYLKCNICTKQMKIIKQISNGLYELNSIGLLHGDLKPENVLIFENHENDECTYKISDFGSTSFMKDQNYNIKGTQQFMAPEQFDENKQLDQSIDIWSLGCIFYELLTNTLLKKPIDVEQIDFDKFGSMGILLNRMLQIDPKKRIKIEELIDQLILLDN